MALPELSTESIVTYVGIALGTAVAAFVGYFRGKKEEAKPSKDVIIREATIADVSWGRESAATLVEVRDVLVEIRDLMRDEFETRAAQNESMERAEQSARLSALEDLLKGQFNHGQPGPRRRR